MSLKKGPSIIRKTTEVLFQILNCCPETILTKVNCKASAFKLVNDDYLNISIAIRKILVEDLNLNWEFLPFLINVRLITITNCKLLWSLPLLAFISILLQLLENSKSASLQDQMTNYHLENHSWSNNCISCSVEVVPYGTLIYQSNDITMRWNYFWHSILIIM